jgi:uncharacterized protein YdeI (YjbR/CyaY-like superfamily)
MPANRRDYEHVEARSRAEWRTWLDANHADSPGIWLVYGKKSAGPERLSYEEAVEEALCFGWIDSVGGKVDDTRTKILMTPRRPGSAWSTVNKERIERLLAAGLMTPAGQAKIDQGKRDGSWALYDQIEDLTVPDDLAAALVEDEATGNGFAAFSPSGRKALLLWLATAKQPATRARRIGAIVDGARAGLSPLDWRGNRDRRSSGETGP